MKTLILCDNQDITNAGLLLLCGQLSGIGMISQAENRQKLLPLLAGWQEAVVVLDYTLFDFESADELIVLQARFPAVRWLLFSDELSEAFIRRILFSSDAFGMVLKDASLDEIRLGLQCALRSERFVCHRIANLLLSPKPDLPAVPPSLLTLTEKEILKAIASGRSTKEIASERFSSTHTIATHRKNIFRKLEVNNVREAIRYAFRAGLIDVAEYSI